MYRIGVDLGGTNIVTGVVDEDFRIVGKGTVKTRKNSSEEVIIDDIKQSIKMAVSSAKIDWSEVKCIGIGTPGTVNIKDGIIEYASNLDFDNTPIKKIIEDEFHIPTYIENDANCAALGEALAGAGNGVENFMAITLGTGVGAGIVIGGKILHGCNNAAGEIGHMVIKFGGERCTCGRRGCWETYASATALIRQTQDAMSRNFDTIMWDMVSEDIRKVDGTTAFEAMRENDLVAREVINNYIYYVAVGIVNIINIFQPEILCIGGGIGSEGESLLSPIRYYVKNERYSIYAKQQTYICAAVLGNDAGVIGAALLDKQFEE